LLRHGLVEGKKRKRRREDYRRWERGRAMELWQMDVIGRVHLAGGLEVKVVTGIDDHFRFIVCAKLVVRATARPVCVALAEALARHGVPAQILTDGKVFTARFGPGPGPVKFDQICADNGIRHLLTAPYSPTGKVERLHKTMRAEFFNGADRVFATVPELQSALDGWVEQYNTIRPHHPGQPRHHRGRLRDDPGASGRAGGGQAAGGGVAVATGPGGRGPAPSSTSPSSPGRSSCPKTARSSGCTRSATTAPASSAPSPTPRAAPAARTPPSATPPYDHVAWLPEPICRPGTGT
jgi:hypothetical protein